MYERIKSLYKQNRLTDEMLEVAVSKTWITPEEKIEIMTCVTTS